MERVSKEFDHVFIDSQGFVRRFDKKTGEVGMRSGLDISALAGVDVLKTDLEELAAWVGTSNKESAIRQLSRFVNVSYSLQVRVQSKCMSRVSCILRLIPFKVDVSDTTGAGDIMMSTFAARFTETESLKKHLHLRSRQVLLAVRNYRGRKSDFVKGGSTRIRQSV